MKKKTTEEFKKEIYELVGDEYTLMDEYINCQTKVTMLHNKCGNEYKVKPNDFQQGHRCPFCKNNNKRKTNKEFIQRVKDQVGNEYTFLEEYINSRTKLKVKHNSCSKVYSVKPADFLQGCRCPYCNNSKGETVIEKWLTKNNYKYEKQFSFSDCKYKRVLPFDFKLEDSSGKIILIEYDGVQHFKECWYSESFELQQTRDNIKNDYCNSHDNIDLYRINYKDYKNIEAILEDILNKYKI